VQRPQRYEAPGKSLLFDAPIVPTFQPAHFGLVYAAYGGIFIILSLIWSKYVDRIRPDRYDILGGAICLVGVFVIMYWPRVSSHGVP